MKHSILIVFVICFYSGFSQIKKPQNNPYYDYEVLHFGFSIGFNMMDFSITPAYSVLSPDSVKSVEVNRFPGFNLNIVSNLRLTDNLDLRFLPGLVFGQRNLIYTIDTSGMSSAYDKLIPIESIFVEAPLLLKYKSNRLNNHRPYVIGGFTYRFDMDAKEIITDEKRKNRPRRLNRSDLYYEIGVGIDYYLPYFKLSSELKFSVGLIDILKPDESKLTSSIDRMTSKLVILTFHFE